jgi:hypothetical protein
MLKGGAQTPVLCRSQLWLVSGGVAFMGVALFGMLGCSIINCWTAIYVAQPGDDTAMQLA